MMDQVEFGFVAALEREVSGLVRGWDRVMVQNVGKAWRVYRQGRAAVICAGTGTERAYSATKVLFENCSPRVVTSIGFVGSCVASLPVGSIVVPATVIEAGTGQRYSCSFGSGQLVTVDRVAGKAVKQDAHERLGAVVVDMEASGVAAAAVELGREFAAIKAVSDGAEEDLEFLSGFVTPQGFATGRFVAHIALRPGLWPSVRRLQANSDAASKALVSAVEACIHDEKQFALRYRKTAAQV